MKDIFLKLNEIKRLLIINKHVDADVIVDLLEDICFEIDRLKNIQE